MLTDAIEANSEDDIFILIAGDVDYVSGIRKIKSRNFEYRYCFWNNASTALKMKRNSYPSSRHFSEVRVE
jgi:hypothetical protein